VRRGPNEDARIAKVLTNAATALPVSEILGLMWVDLNFADQVIEVKRAYVWSQFKVPKSKASKAPVLMHPILAGFSWRGERNSVCRGRRLRLPELPT
jgi:integrase